MVQDFYDEDFTRLALERSLMRLLPHVALAVAVFSMAAGAVPASASPSKDTSGVAAAAAGWGLAYEADPTTGRSVLLGFANPNGQVVPFAEGQQGYTADPRTGELTALVPGQILPAVPADIGTGNQRSLLQP